MSVGFLLRNGLPFSNVVANGVATANVTPGRTIRRIILALGGTSLTKAMLTLIKVKANSKTIFEGSGSQIDKINKYRGITDNAAFLTLDFIELFGTDKDDKYLGAWDTSQGIGNITIEVTIAGATAPTLTYSTEEAAPQKGAIAPLMSKLLRYPFNVSTGGKLNVALPFGINGAGIKRLHVEHTGNMTGVTCKENSNVLHESLLALNSFINTEHKKVPQTNLYTVDFTLNNDRSESWNTQNNPDQVIRSVELIPEFSAADSGYVMVEYYDGLGNL